MNSWGNVRGIRKNFVFLILIVFLFSWCACAKNSSNQGTENAGVSSEEGGEKKMKLTSPAFRHGEKIPVKYTGDAEDISPPLQWNNVPEGTKSFALICDDPDAPVGTWVHWVIFNIPGEVRELREGIPAQKELPDGTKQGLNDFRKTGYGGPAPPRGKPHRYFFKIYALDTILNLSPDIRKPDLLRAMQGHILATGELMGTYQR